LPFAWYLPDIASRLVFFDAAAPRLSAFDEDIYFGMMPMFSSAAFADRYFRHTDY